MCDVLDKLQTAKAGHPTDGLGSAIEAYLLATSAEMDEDRDPNTRAKRNWALHIHKQVQDDGGRLVDCFTTERKNALSKAIASTLTTEHFEKSMLARLLSAQYASLLKNDKMFEDGVLETGYKKPRDNRKLVRVNPRGNRQ